MATLVLTAVGTAIGGPIGGALGALAGQAFDHGVLFRSGPREGPRLTELRVQTSSYGSAIPQLFGTMRVAGTVIWSTDLIETRAVARAGKGQPGTARYSYRASFAVLLSARRVASVGRIWADGELIRGSAGDWKVQTGFRLHTGGEDQPVDPLIASAEGAGLAPAHRGCAYVVFEDLALEPFGNRLPSLTFEVVADAGPVGVGSIAATLAPEVTGTPALMVDGFAGTGGSVAAVLATLATASGAWFAPVGSTLAMRDTAAPMTTLTPQTDRSASRTIAAADRAPTVVTVSHYDPARNWQAGLQRARRSGAGSGTLALEVPAAVSAVTAKAIAAAALARTMAARVTRTVPAALAALMLKPGDVVTLSDEGGAWRVDELALEAPSTGVVIAATLTLTPLPMGGAVVGTASSGRVLAAPDLAIGATLLHAAELPALDDAVLAQPRLLVVASGTGAGWRGAALMLSMDGGGSWTEAGGTAGSGTMGIVEVPLSAGDAALIERATSLTVQLARADMVLGDADAGALDGGANLALVGDELVQFGRAMPLGSGRWSLSVLWRGRRATAPVAGAAGDRFVVLDADSVRVIDLPLAALGSSVQVMAAGVGDGDPPPVVTVPIRGASILPPSPVTLRWSAEPEGGAEVAWTRRSRAGWRWIDGVDAPLGEENEAYQVTIAVAGVVREAIVAVPTIAVTAAERAAGSVVVTVRQRGTFGDSASATITIG